MTLCPNYDVVCCTKRDPPKDEKRIHNSIKSTVNASRSSFLSLFKKHCFASKNPVPVVEVLSNNTHF